MPEMGSFFFLPPSLFQRDSFQRISPITENNGRFVRSRRFLIMVITSHCSVFPDVIVAITRNHDV